MERVDADMICSGCPVLADTRDERLLITPGNQRIDQPVRQAAGEVAVVETGAAPTVHVVRQGEIWQQVRARDTAGTCGIGFEHDLLLHTQELAGSENRACLGGLRNRRVVGMRAVGEIPRECEHLGAECSEYGRARIGDRGAE